MYLLFVNKLLYFTNWSTTSETALVQADFWGFCLLTDVTVVENADLNGKKIFVSNLAYELKWVNPYCLQRVKAEFEKAIPNSNEKRYVFIAIVL